MTSIVNISPPPPQPVQCNFTWEQGGPLQEVTYDGDKYPYPPLTEEEVGVPGPDERYLMKTTVIGEQLIFDATKLNEPHVITPPGVSILEYSWHFGDGAIGNGPVITHEYRVLDPELEVTLTVTDSRGLRWSCARQVTLIIENLGHISPFHIRSKSEAPGALKLKRSGADTAVTVDVATI